MLRAATRLGRAAARALPAPARPGGRPRSAPQRCAASLSPAQSAAMSSALEVVRVPCLSDNYAWLVRDAATGATAVVDTPEVAPVVAALEERGWTLTHILNTHHHADHVGGNLELKEKYGCIVVGPMIDERITGRDVGVSDGDTYEFGSQRARVIFTPGHTRGHIVYYFEDARALFSGDTLFSMGCGRLFEGTPGQMWDSLQKLLALPDDTTVYCAHEYTAANGRFAMSVEPTNAALQARVAEVAAMRERGAATVPTTMALEKATNPFLRPDSPALQECIGMAGRPLGEVWAETRKRKDNF